MCASSMFISFSFFLIVIEVFTFFFLIIFFCLSFLSPYFLFFLYIFFITHFFFSFLLSYSNCKDKQVSFSSFPPFFFAFLPLFSFVYFFFLFLSFFLALLIVSVCLYYIWNFCCSCFFLYLSL